MNLVHEFRHVLRSLARQPTVSAVAIVTLALGFGLNSAVVAVAYGILWRPLPFRDAERLVTIGTVYHQNPDIGGVRLDQFEEWTDRLRTADLAGYQARERSLRASSAARIVTAATIIPDFFAVLGAAASEGLAPSLAAGDPRAVISARLARLLERSIRSAADSRLSTGERTPTSRWWRHRSTTGSTTIRRSGTFLRWPDSSCCSSRAPMSRTCN
jgi:hypothetical protein